MILTDIIRTGGQTSRVCLLLLTRRVAPVTNGSAKGAVHSSGGGDGVDAGVQSSRVLPRRPFSRTGVPDLETRGGHALLIGERSERPR